MSLAEVEAVRGQADEAERLLEPLVLDANANPSRRADAAFDLAAIRRAQGRFRDAIRALEQARAPIQSEKIREALTASTQAMCYLELGELKRAEALAREAIKKSPGVPTRYLFTLAQVQLAQGKPADARATATEILKGALPPSDPDRTEDKAAACIRGLALLKEGKAAQAQEELSRAVALSGYEVLGVPAGTGAGVSAGRRSRRGAGKRERGVGPRQSGGAAAGPQSRSRSRRAGRSGSERGAGATRGSRRRLPSSSSRPGPVRIQACRMWRRPAAWRACSKVGAAATAGWAFTPPPPRQTDTAPFRSDP